MAGISDVLLNLSVKTTPKNLESAFALNIFTECSWPLAEVRLKSRMCAVGHL